jgi:hypothetical protein
MKLMRTPSPLLMNLLIFAALATIGWLSFDHYDHERQFFERLSGELAQASSLSQQIALLRQKPDRAASQSRSDQSLAETIEKSTASAGLAREQIARIEPQQPRRSGESEYLDHSTVVQLDGVSLAQLASTVVALRGHEGLEQLRVSTLRIAAPFQTAQSGDMEVWNVELTLTYYVYSPKTAAARKS